MTEQKQDRKAYLPEEKKDRWIDLLFFLLLLAGACAVTLFLFYHQTTGNESRYHSDMKAYILEMQGKDSGYSFPYPVFFKLAAFLHLFTAPELAVALATMLLNALGMIVMKYYLNRYTLKALTEAFRKLPVLRGATWLCGVLCSVLAVSLFFVSMIYLPDGILPPGLRFKYLGVFTANPFHNATYMAARPFAICAFFAYAQLLDRYEEGAALKEYLWFAAVLLLATMTKPSFTIVLVGAAGLIMLWRLVRSRGANFAATLRLGLCFVPTFIDLLYQFRGVFVPSEGEEGGLGFCLGEVWGLYCTNFPAAIALGMGFPLTVLLFHYKEIVKNTVYRFSWQIYLMSFAMAFFLYEKGFRKPDFNFSWGYMYGIFFGFAGSLLILLQSMRELPQKPASPKEKGTSSKALLWWAFSGLQWLAYLAHLTCGLYYFYGILKGNMYY